MATIQAGLPGGLTPAAPQTIRPTGAVASTGKAVSAYGQDQLQLARPQGLPQPPVRQELAAVNAALANPRTPMLAKAQLQIAREYLETKLSVQGLNVPPAGRAALNRLGDITKAAQATKSAANLQSLRLAATVARFDVELSGPHTTADQRTLLEGMRELGARAASTTNQLDAARMGLAFDVLQRQLEATIDHPGAAAQQLLGSLTKVGQAAAAATTSAAFTQLQMAYTAMTLRYDYADSGASASTVATLKRIGDLAAQAQTTPDAAALARLQIAMDGLVGQLPERN